MPVYSPNRDRWEWESINTWNGHAVGVNGVISGLGRALADGLNNTVFDEDGIRLSQRACQISRCRCSDQIEDMHGLSQRGHKEEKAPEIKDQFIPIMGYFEAEHQ